MEHFIGAHVPKPECRGKKSAIKKHLKKMLHAYQKGNNELIRDSGEAALKYNADDLLSYSDYSEISFNREANMSTDKSNYTDTSSGGADRSSASNISDAVRSVEDSRQSTTGNEVEELDDRSREMSSNSESNSSLISDTQSSSGSASIPSSLVSYDSEDERKSTDFSSYEEFDPDGTLASKIMEQLQKRNMKRKSDYEPVKEVVEIPLKEKVSIKMPKKSQKYNLLKKCSTIQEIEVVESSNGDNVEREISPAATDLKGCRKVNKKPKKEKLSSIDSIIEEIDMVDSPNDFIDEISPRSSFSNVSKKNSKKSKKQKHLKKCDTIGEFDEVDSLNNFIEDEISTQDSDSESDISPYVSVSATDMSDYRLSDILGNYVHPTTKNLPSEKHHVIKSNLFQTEEMNVDDEIGSLIPELDEELTIDDLNLSDSKDSPIVESSNYDGTELSEEADCELTEAESIKVYRGRDSYIITMKHPTELYIHGKLKLTAMSGQAEVFGYTLNHNIVDVYAPYCNYAYCVETLGKESNFKGLFRRLTSAGLTVADAEEVVTSINEYDTVLSLNKLNSRRIDFVDNNFNNLDLFSKRSDSTPRFLKKAAESLGCSLYLEPQKRIFEEKSCWNQVVSCGLDDYQSKGIICGGKDTGKSTFLRYYVNRLLAKGPVLVVDLDPGQTEFTVPGSLSVVIVKKPLLGPNFTHQIEAEKSLNIGMINTMDNPFRYLEAVRDLLEFCYSHDSYCNLPWVVNTMGMTNHIGLKFMTYIITQLRPTFVYQIDSRTAKNRFGCELNSLTVGELCKEFSKDSLFSETLDSNINYAFILEKYQDMSTGSKVPKALMPRDERYLNVLAYFSKLLDSHTSQGLLEIAPYEVSLKNLNIAVNVKIPEETITKVINGKIVALCQQTSQDKGRVFTLTSRGLLCHGHGLVRGVDDETEVMYILTPVSMDKLRLVDTLLYSDWMPELSGTERQLPDDTAVPYRSATIDQQKLMNPPKRRFNPLQLLKMSRNT